MAETGSAETRHETRDVAVGPLMWFVLGLVVLILGASAGLELVFGGSQPQPRPVEHAGPELQRHPEQDLAAFEARQRARLEALDWVDRKQGLARIPIEEAMRLIAENGLPERPKPGDCDFVGAAVPRAPQGECGK